jgi:protein involved in polysaccharide export with SLBB domain
MRRSAPADQPVGWQATHENQNLDDNQSARRRTGMRWLVVVCCVAALFLGSCVGRSRMPKEPVFTANDAVAAAPSVEEQQYVIEAGDFLNVVSQSRPQVSCVGRVGEDGTVVLEVTGYVRAEGSTVEQFTQTLGELYKEEPGYETGVEDLTVEVKLGLYLVTGEVAGPGFRAYREGLTVYDAVMAGGKFTENALRDRIYLNRKGAEGREIIRYTDIDQLKELPLEENDWVVIPYRVEHLLH